MKYEVDMKPVFKQKLPKKYVFSRRIRVTKKYELNASFWIPDTPYSQNPPMIALTLSHGKGYHSKEYIRITFETTEDVVEFVSQFERFSRDAIGELHKHLREALLEWEGLQAKRIESLEGMQKNRAIN